MKIYAISLIVRFLVPFIVLDEHNKQFVVLAITFRLLLFDCALPCDQIAQRASRQTQKTNDERTQEKFLIKFHGSSHMWDKFLGPLIRAIIDLIGRK